MFTLALKVDRFSLLALGNWATRKYSIPSTFCAVLLFILNYSIGLE